MISTLVAAKACKLMTLGTFSKLHVQKSNYFDILGSSNPFPDSSMLDPANSDDHEAIVQTVKKMVPDASSNGLSNKIIAERRAVISNHTNIFRKSFSSGPLAHFLPINLKLQRNTKPIHVFLRNYFQAQRALLAKTYSILVAHKMVYPNSIFLSGPSLHYHRPRFDLEASTSLLTYVSWTNSHSKISI